ncbi:hypothetical protein Psuf_000310 [Phytohabitans suffuscus]|uniref:HTH luxR-type domain-containing protein n=2 Tax=Phytohabitans suffuscus TaxID=624315 RepID=A0A6F8Y9Q8_9ACTN|nr:hypothetical protein Psuf_000310 [Phytohabitans suffuscus]
MGQLMAGTKLPAERAEQATRLLEYGALAAPLRATEREESAQVPFQVLNGLTEILLEQARSGPLLIGVDDAHFADLPSLQHLLYLVRRIGNAGVLVVLNETTFLDEAYAMLRAELLNQPQCRHLTLRPLSQGAAARLLDQRLNAPVPQQRAKAYYEITGGNPLLLNALINDAGPGEDPDDPVLVGDGYSSAVLNCLYRSGDGIVLRLARVLAVLGEPASPALVGQLLGLDAEATTRAIGVATDMGLLREGQFRHEAVRRTVLNWMSAEERAELREFTAKVLHENGADVVSVARHVIAANRPDASWSVSMLREAAEKALEEGDIVLALESCRRAERAGGDEMERAAAKAVLFRIQCLLDPSLAERVVPELKAAARAGHLSVENGVCLVHYLLWQGRPDEAVELLELFSETVDPEDADLVITLHVARLAACYAYPGLLERMDIAYLPAELGTYGAITPHTTQLRVARVLQALINGSIDDAAVADAEQILQQVSPDSAPLELNMICLEALASANRLVQAAALCDSLLETARRRRFPVWQAMYAAVRGAISFRQGDLAAAERHAHSAMSQLSPRNWGVLLGIPLSVLIASSVRSGAGANVGACLDMPVPQAMYQTRFGLHCMRARGRHYLSKGHWQSAQRAFDTCRDLMLRWEIDLPALVPWRGDMAEVAIGLGDRERARQLIHEQLARLGPRHVRDRGLSLRILAAASDPPERDALLTEAIEALRASGDQVGLAAASADLSNARRDADARKAKRKASRLRGRPRRPDPGDRKPGFPPDPGSSHEWSRTLSGAERRVASLAACGYTNRQIALTLYVTVSTVEQHLTRVYRKLRVGRRADLARQLRAELRDSA